MADDDKKLSSGVHGLKDTVALQPGEGRGNAMDADGAGLVCLTNLGRGLCSSVDVLRLI